MCGKRGNCVEGKVSLSCSKICMKNVRRRDYDVMVKENSIAKRTLSISIPSMSPQKKNTY